jgi:hypothetical protein
MYNQNYLESEPCAIDDYTSDPESVATTVIGGDEFAKAVCYLG